MDYQCPLEQKTVCHGCFHAEPHEFESAFCGMFCGQTDRACTCVPVQQEGQAQLVGDPSLVTSSAVVPEFVRKLDTSE